jgi:hypothetical protein
VSTWCLAIALTLAAPLAGAAVAGRVLAAVGDTSALRDGKVVALRAGAPVQDRDTLRTGPASSLQVRLSDESLIALRATSELRIDEYRFGGQGEERAFFRLLKGAMRTVTGLIGRVRYEDYGVRTSGGTIGIRGTLYALAECQQDCQADDGTLAPDGVYGVVLGESFGTSRLTATNRAGEKVLEQGQAFYLADESSLPELLLEPPGFLSDRLSGIQSPGAGEQGLAEGAQAGGIQSDGRPNALLPPLAAVSQGTTLSDFSATQTLGPNGNTAVIPVRSQNFIPIGGEGIIRGQLAWATNADLDLHLLTPDQQEVFFGNTTAEIKAPDGVTVLATAALDHDNLGGQIDVAPDLRVENITVNGTPPAGTYAFFVKSFRDSNPSTTGVVRITGDNGLSGREFSTTLVSGQESDRYNVLFNGGGQAPGYSVTPR